MVCFLLFLRWVFHSCVLQRPVSVWFQIPGPPLLRRKGRNPHRRTSWKLVANPGYQPKKVAN